MECGLNSGIEYWTSVDISYRKLYGCIISCLCIGDGDGASYFYWSVGLRCNGMRYVPVILSLLIERPAGRLVAVNVRTSPSSGSVADNNLGQ